MMALEQPSLLTFVHCLKKNPVSISHEMNTVINTVDLKLEKNSQLPIHFGSGICRSYCSRSSTFSKQHFPSHDIDWYPSFIRIVSKTLLYIVYERAMTIRYLLIESIGDISIVTLHQVNDILSGKSIVVIRDGQLRLQNRLFKEFLLLCSASVLYGLEIYLQ